MTVNIRATEASNTAKQLDILALYRTMVTARVTNDILKTRKTQGRFPFYIGCAGHALCVKLTHARPGQWVQAAICLRTIVANVIAFYLPSVK